MKKGLFFLAVLLFVIKVQAQNVGIGTTLPLIKLHIKGGLLLDSTNGTTPVSGAGTRMMWIPAKAAFRAGTVSGTQWDDVNIGLYSIALGISTKASGDFSSAMGILTTAQGLYSTAMGANTIASGDASTTMGQTTQASGNNSTAMGKNTIASNEASTAMGAFTQANGINSTAMGAFAIASNDASTAMGQSTTASGGGSTAMGQNTTASAAISTAMGFNTKAQGLYSTAMGGNTIASNDASTAMGEATTASGINSTAMGQNTMASALNSTAMGQNSIAAGNYSTAMGFFTNAQGFYSTAMGYQTTASGEGSTSLGNGTKSKSYGGLVIGHFNDSTNAVNPTGINALNRIFQIGNGTSDVARSNAMTVLQNGKVGIGTTDPVALLHAKNGAVLFDGTTGSTPISGAGTRMMWVPSKAAFRAGIVSGTEWNDANIGLYSIAFGNATIASGNSSIAMGEITIASGSHSAALGYSSIASGDYNTAMGYFTKSKSYGGFTTGLYNDSTNAASPITSNPLNRIFQIGNGTADNARNNAMTVLQNGNVGIGTITPDALLHIVRNANAGATYNAASEIIMENNSTSYMEFSNPTVNETGIISSNPTIGLRSAVIFTAANGMQLRTGGNVNRLQIDNGGFIGINRTPVAGTSTGTLQIQGVGSGDDILGIYNSTGTNRWTYYTAATNLVLYNNGILRGDWSSVNGVYTSSSDRRLKKDITEIPVGALAKINSLKAYSFRYHDNASTDPLTIGFMAQEVQPLFPEAVTEITNKDGSTSLGLKYQYFGVYAIKAIQEQQQIIDKQQQRIDNLEKMVNELSSKVNR